MFILLLAIRSMKVRSSYGIVIVALFIFVGFRFEVGCDWRGYIFQFIEARNKNVLDALGDASPLWELALVVQNKMDIAYPWINVFSAIIFFIGIDKLANRQPDRVGFLILLFPILIVNLAMSGIRQAASTGLLCVAFVAFQERRLPRFISWVLAAAAFHSSALVFLLLAPLVGGAYSVKRLGFSGLLAIPGAVALMSTRAAETAVTRYVGTAVDASGAAFRAGLMFVTALYFFFVARKKWAASSPHDYSLVLTGSFLMVMTALLVPISSVISDRIGYYLVPLQTVVLARLPYLTASPNKSYISAVPYIVLMIVLGVWTTYSMLFQRCYVPYQTWIFGFPQARYAF